MKSFRVVFVRCSFGVVVVVVYKDVVWQSSKEPTEDEVYDRIMSVCKGRMGLTIVDGGQNAR